MVWTDVLLIVAVAFACGTLGQLTSSYTRGGWIVHLGIGLVGSALGVWVARTINVPTVYLLPIGPDGFPIIWALIGSVLLVAVVGFFFKPRSR